MGYGESRIIADIMEAIARRITTNITTEELILELKIQVLKLEKEK